MALLKEDGSLDVERINKLPLEEWLKEVGGLMQEQFNEFNSKTPLNESKEPIRSVLVDYPMEEDGVDAKDFINKLRERREKRK